MIKLNLMNKKDIEESIQRLIDHGNEKKLKYSVYDFITLLYMSYDRGNLTDINNLVRIRQLVDALEFDKKIKYTDSIQKLLSAIKLEEFTNETNN